VTDHNGPADTADRPIRPMRATRLCGRPADAGHEATNQRHRRRPNGCELRADDDLLSGSYRAARQPVGLGRFFARPWRVGCSMWDLAFSLGATHSLLLTGCSDPGASTGPFFFLIGALVLSRSVKGASMDARLAWRFPLLWLISRVVEQFGRGYDANRLVDLVTHWLNTGQRPVHVVAVARILSPEISRCRRDVSRKPMVAIIVLVA